MSPIIVSDSAKDWRPAPQGLHQAVCCDVIDLGMLETEWNGEKKIQRKVKVVWQIDAINDETNRRHLVQCRYTASLHEKARLCQHLESWRGRQFTPEEKKGFDIENLIGVNCQIMVVHNVTDRGTYANVQSIVPLGKNTEKMTVMGYVREKDRQDDSDAPPPDEYHDSDEIPF